MFQVVVGPGLERVRQEEQFRLTEQLASHVEAGWRLLKEPARYAQDGIPETVGE
jgi:hypothetical protein